MESFQDIEHFVKTLSAAIKKKIPTKVSQLTNDAGYKTTDTNTTYKLSKSGSTVTLTGSDGSTTSVTDDNAMSNTLWEKIYPVGSIYISANSTSPANLFGGTWEQIKDRFLLAAGDTYAAGSTGGEAQHTLTADEMPSHNHIVCDDIAGKANVAQINAWRINELPNTKVTYVQKGQSFDGAETEPTGGSQPHNNMPPYLAVYMWKRVS